MKLSFQGIQDKSAWEKAGVTLPKYDWEKMCSATEKNPIWVHFGAGNIFRGFIAGLQDKLLNENLADKGIIAIETFDYEIIDKIYKPHDSMTLMVSLRPDGKLEKNIIASIACGVKANEWEALKKIFVKKISNRFIFSSNGKLHYNRKRLRIKRYERRIFARSC